MTFDAPLTEGVLQQRYKRFLADVELPGGEVVTVHCPNTGSMLGCDAPGSRVWLSRSANPRREYALTWELVETRGKTLVGIHTGRANGLVREAIEAGRLPALAGYRTVRAEARLPERGSRMDFLLGGHDRSPDCYLEVKNVTAAVEGGIAVFPDAVSARGTRHLETLQALRGAGYRAALVFCVQRGDVEQVQPADRIDPAYGRALRAARSAGGEVFALRGRVSPAGISLEDAVPVHCPPDPEPTSGTH